MGNYGTVELEEKRLKEKYTQIPNTILQHPTISPGAKLTYAMLLLYAWQEGSCFPGQDRLAQDIGSSVRSVIRWLQELQSSGLVKVRRQGMGKSNIYTLAKWVDGGSVKMSLLDVTKTDILEVTKTDMEVDSINYTHGSTARGSLFPAPMARLITEVSLQFADPSPDDSFDRLRELWMDSTIHMGPSTFMVAVQDSIAEARAGRPEGGWRNGQQSAYFFRVLESKLKASPT